MLKLKKISSLPHRQQGATAVEYGLIVGVIIAVIAVVLIAIGGNLNGLFTIVSNAIASAT